MTTPQIDIDWVLDENVQLWVTKLGLGNYLIREVFGDRKLTLSFTDSGRLLFDGQDIETEAFIAYVGLIDYVEEIPLRVVYVEGE